MTSNVGVKKMPEKEMNERRGKGASDLSADGKKIDPFVGFILLASLPLALLVFWKITIPLAYFCVSTVLGTELMQKINFLRQDVVHLMTSQCPPWISAEERAFLDMQDYRPVRRFQDISKGQFEEQMDNGEPFILTDAMRSWPNDWDCSEFIRRYPEAEYFDWQSGRYHSLKDITGRSGYVELDCASGEIDMSKVNEEYFKEWLKQTPAPYFMDDSYSTSARNNSVLSMDFYIGASGTGTPPHVEESCMNYMVAQFSGVTAWSFSRPIVENEKITWSKPMRIFLQPGEVIFWFPSMRYHKEVADGCSLSARLGFQTPAPKRFLEQVQKDISSWLPEDDRDSVLSATDVSALNFISKCSIVEENGRWVLR